MEQVNSADSCQRRSRLARNRAEMFASLNLSDLGDQFSSRGCCTSFKSFKSFKSLNWTTPFLRRSEPSHLYAPTQGVSLQLPETSIGDFEATAVL